MIHMRRNIGVHNRMSSIHDFGVHTHAWWGVFVENFYPRVCSNWNFIFRWLGLQHDQQLDRFLIWSFIRDRHGPFAMLCKRCAIKQNTYTLLIAICEHNERKWERPYLIFRHKAGDLDVSEFVVGCYVSARGAVRGDDADAGRGCGVVEPHDQLAVKTLVHRQVRLVSPLPSKLQVFVHKLLD